MPGILPQIQHVVLLMLENRSLDNLLGWLYSDGAPPKHNIPAPPPGQPPSFDGLVEGRYSNRLKRRDGIIVRHPIQRGTAGFSVPTWNPYETYEHVVNQLFGDYWPVRTEPPVGTRAEMQGFLQDFATFYDNPAQILQTYTPRQLPVMNGLARSYAVSDAWFSSVPTQTNSNRAFAACGTSLGLVNNDYLNGFDTDTIWNVLSRRGDESWEIYYQNRWFHHTCYTRFLFPRIPGQDSHFLRMEEFHRKSRAGTLPAFSFLEPAWHLIVSNGNDYHPPADVRAGETFVKEVYESLLSNRRAWERTLFIITFDEHGGTWDHVGPPWGATPPDDRVGPSRFRFNRFGVRVPALLISPWIEEQTVFRSSTAVPYDHTSLIATLLKWRGIEPATAGLGRRVAVAPTFEGVLTRSTPRPEAPSFESHPQATAREAVPGPLLVADMRDEYLELAAHYVVAAGRAGSRDVQTIVEDIRAQCRTEEDLSLYMEAPAVAAGLGKLKP